jgi:hypothetical protein
MALGDEWVDDLLHRWIGSKSIAEKLKSIHEIARSGHYEPSAVAPDPKSYWPE